MMSKIAFFSFFILLASAAGLLADVGVSVEDNFFSSPAITVPVGTTVIWTNNGRTSHTVTSGTLGSPTGLFDRSLNPGQTTSFTFNTPGTFPYFCEIHPPNMKGTVTVTCGNKSQLLKNPGFEGGNVNWTANSPTIINNTTAFPPRTGTRKAQLNGKGTKNTQFIFQQVALPSTACTAILSFYLRIATTETSGAADDKLKVQILNSAGVVLKTLKTFSNLNKSAGYVKKSFSIVNFKGQTIRVRFQGTEDSGDKTTFLIDDTAVNITR